MANGALSASMSGKAQCNMQSVYYLLQTIPIILYYITAKLYTMQVNASCIQDG